MKTLTILLTTGLLALAGCGDDDDDSGGSAPATSGERPSWRRRKATP